MQNTKHIILVTGAPGTGKTTVITKVAEALKAQGYRTGGMTTKEKRQGEARVGFQILDLATQKQGWLAHVNQLNGPRIGKYQVNLNGLDSIGASAIQEGIKTADVIVIDEIGPMELYSQIFKQAVQQAIDSAKPVIATIHYKATDAFVKNIKTRSDAELCEVTMENRNVLHNLIIEKINKILQGNPKC
jgi:nucleoside-triphosphatase